MATVEHRIGDRPVYTVAEASDILRVPAKTIKRRLERAGVAEAGWIIPGKLAVYWPADLGMDADLSGRGPWVIPAQSWSEGLEYAYYRDGREAPRTLEEMGNDVRWSPGLPAWAEHDRPLVVRRRCFYCGQYVTEHADDCLLYGDRRDDLVAGR